MATEKYPIAGKDYPRTFQEFDSWFATEKACENYLKEIRWAEGFRCPHCGSQNEPWTTNRDLMHCRDCQGQTSVTAGTIFEGTRKPLRTWFLAMWFITSQKQGVSALGIQRTLGLGSYQTAWAWFHKIRRAMVSPGRNRLTGMVEVDETYVGAPEEEVHGREIETKSIVLIAAEIRGKGTGRIRLQRINNCSSESIIPFVHSSIIPGSVVVTDGWRGYSPLIKEGYKHDVLNIKESGKPAHKLLPRVHKVASLLKRWLLGTLQGGIHQKHLDYYLDEFTFRFNRRNSRSRGMLFYRLVQQAVSVEPVTYREIIGEKE